MDPADGLPERHGLLDRFVGERGPPGPSIIAA